MLENPHHCSKRVGDSPGDFWSGLLGSALHIGSTDLFALSPLDIAGPEQKVVSSRYKSVEE